MDHITLPSRTISWVFNFISVKKEMKIGFVVEGSQQGSI